MLQSLPEREVHLNRYFNLTQLIFSCWVVSANEEDSLQYIPIGRGLLDLALKNSVKRGAFPEWAKNQLHFVSGEAGVVCLELARIEERALETGLISVAGPTYTEAKIMDNKLLARRSLARLEIEELQAVVWGQVLREEVARARKNH